MTSWRFVTTAVAAFIEHLPCAVPVTDIISCHRHSNLPRKGLLLTPSSRRDPEARGRSDGPPAPPLGGWLRPNLGRPELPCTVCPALGVMTQTRKAPAATWLTPSFALTGLSKSQKRKVMFVKCQAGAQATGTIRNPGGPIVRQQSHRVPTGGSLQAVPVFVPRAPALACPEPSPCGARLHPRGHANTIAPSVSTSPEG